MRWSRVNGDVIHLHSDDETCILAAHTVLHFDVVGIHMLELMGIKKGPIPGADIDEVEGI